MPSSYVPGNSYYKSNSTGWYSDAPSVTLVGSLSFSTDGKKMFYLDYGNTVRYYSLSTPWAIETSSFIYAYPPFASYYSKMQIAYDGINAYLGTASDIKHIILPSPYDFSSFTSSGTLAGANKSFYVNNQGNKLYKLDSAILAEYTLASRWNVASAVATGNTYNFGSTPSNADFYFSDTGQYLFYIIRNGTNLGNSIRRYNMDSSGNIGALTLNTTYTVSGFSSSGASLYAAFRPFGNEYYVSDSISNSIYNLTV
jgi:hypothetical protein